MRTFPVLCSLTLLTAPALAGSCSSWSVHADGHVKGQGDVVQRTLTVADFHGLVLEGAMDVDLTPSDTRSVVVEAQANIAELVTAEVRDGVCHLSTREGYSTDKPFIVHIALPTFDRITLQGSGDVKGLGAFRMDALALSTVGSGDITLDVQAQEVSIAISGSGDMKLTGGCTQLKMNVAGSGDVNARDLRSERASVDIAGSGDVIVNTSKDLAASVTGSGDVVYAGMPTRVQRSISGSGDVRSLNGSSGGPR